MKSLAHRSLLPLLTALAAFAALGDLSCAPSTDAPARPNVLLVSIDSLRADHLHSYGYERETSPTIDAIAAEGVRFETTLSPSSWTLPTHITLLTSLPPVSHGVVNVYTKLADKSLTFAEVLQDAGYSTAAVISGPLVRSVYGHNQGFEFFDESVSRDRGKAYKGVTSPGVVRIATEWLARWDKSGRQKPFFLFVHMWDVHYDYAPPSPYDTLFDPDYTGSLTSEHFEKNPRIHKSMEPRDLAHLIALYDGEIRFTDQQLGRIIDTLRAMHVYDDTITVVTADHGEEFFEHGGKGHGRQLYDEGLRIPFVLRYPRSVPAGLVIKEQVRLMDIAPTILGLIGIRRPAAYGLRNELWSQGAADLSPWLHAGKAVEPFPQLVAYGDLSVANRMLASIRTKTFKLIWFDKAAGRRHELYDLRSDSGERNDLTQGRRLNEPRARVLQESLHQWRRLWDEHQMERSAQPAELGEEHIEQLKALGYIQE